MIKMEAKDASLEKEECIQMRKDEEGSKGQFWKQHVLVEQQQRDIQVIYNGTAQVFGIIFFLPERFIFQFP